MEKTKEQDTKKIKMRSPNFPVISLKQAVEKIQTIYQKENFAPAQRLAVLKHMGYGSENGASRTVLSALKKYDLINEEKGTILLSENAKVIVVCKDDDPRKLVALRESALKPEIYNELWDKYHESGLPSDDSLRTELILHYKFNTRSVSGFISNLRETLDYAKIKSGNENLSNFINVAFDKDENKTKQPDTQQNKPPMNTTISDFKIPIKEKFGLLRLQEPITKRDIEAVSDMLEIIKKNYVEDEKENEPVKVENPEKTKELLKKV